MGTGESGVNGAHVQSLASRENSREHANVTHRRQSMVGRLAKEMEKRPEYAIMMCHVQVG